MPTVGPVQPWPPPIWIKSAIDKKNCSKGIDIHCPHSADWAAAKEMKARRAENVANLVMMTWRGITALKNLQSTPCLISYLNHFNGRRAPVKIHPWTMYKGLGQCKQYVPGGWQRNPDSVPVASTRFTWHISACFQCWFSGQGQGVATLDFEAIESLPAAILSVLPGRAVFSAVSRKSCPEATLDLFLCARAHMGFERIGFEILQGIGPWSVREKVSHDLSFHFSSWECWAWGGNPQFPYRTHRTRHNSTITHHIRSQDIYLWAIHNPFCLIITS